MNAIFPQLEKQLQLYSPMSNLHDQLYYQLADQLHTQLREQLYIQLSGQLNEQLIEDLR